MAKTGVILKNEKIETYGQKMRKNGLNRGPWPMDIGAKTGALLGDPRAIIGRKYR